MKMYTTPEQTAKLIELGFEKPKTIVDKYYDYDSEAYKEVNHFSIGELIAMLPEDIEDKDNRGVWYFRNITGISVFYSREERMNWTDLYISCLHEELIDNLYEMVLQLKEEGVI